MRNNKPIVYKENIFIKIRNFIKRLFGKKEIPIEEKSDESENFDNIANNNFLENIQIKEDTEETRIKKLQQQYDNGEIDEDDLPEEDINKLIEMYERETEKINADTLIRKKHIQEMLKELKSS